MAARHGVIEQAELGRFGFQIRRRVEWSDAEFFRYGYMASLAELAYSERRLASSILAHSSAAPSMMLRIFRTLNGFTFGASPSNGERRLSPLPDV